MHKNDSSKNYSVIVPFKNQIAPYEPYAPHLEPLD